jgi:thiol-disulfide isomerase/thioredoxin
MRILALLALLTMSTIANAQNIPVRYTTSIDSINGSVIYKGLIGFDDLQKDTTFHWYSTGIEKYSPKKRHIKKLKPALSAYTMIVVLGTWCGDSKDLVPKLHNVLVAAEYPMAKVTLYGVDRAKIVGNGADKTYNITRVPTIILFDGTKEIGRITESVEKSVEADLRAILEKYKKS